MRPSGSHRADPYPPARVSPDRESGSSRSGRTRLLRTFGARSSWCLCLLLFGPVGKMRAVVQSPQQALFLDMLQGSLLKIDLDSLLTDLAFEFGDLGFLGPFLSGAAECPFPVLLQFPSPPV